MSEMTSVSEIARQDEASERDLTLEEKLLLVGSQIRDHIKMSGEVKTRSGQLLYRYRTLHDILDVAQPALTSLGVYIAETTEQVQVDDRRALVSMIFTAVDARTKVERTASFWGQGDNASMNGLKSAYTGCRRYAYMHMLGIATGDDDEQEHAQTERGRTRHPAPAARPPATTPAAGSAAVVGLEDKGKGRWVATLVNKEGQSQDFVVWETDKYVGTAIFDVVKQAFDSELHIQPKIRQSSNPKYPMLTIAGAEIVTPPREEPPPPAEDEGAPSADEIPF